MFSSKTRLLLALGGLIAGIYFVRGFYHLAFNPNGGASDLRFRKGELAHFFNRQNPYEVFLANVTPYSQQKLNFEGRNTAPLEMWGPGDAASLPAYPPWAYPVIAAVAWPDLPAVRFYFAFLNVLALLAIGWSILQLFPVAQKERAWLTMTACLMTSTFCMTLGVGQVGVLMLAGLFLSLVFENRDRPLVAGGWLALALIKPTMGLPFLIPFLVKGRWRPVAVAGLITAALWAVSAVVTRTPPFSMLQEWLTASSGLWSEGDGPIHLAYSWGLNRHAFTVIVAAVATGVIWRLRHESLLVLFGLASVGARFWTYHRFYDNILLVFLLLAYCQRLSEKSPPSKSFWIGFALLAISLWPPASSFVVLTNEFQYLAWGLTGGWLAYRCQALKGW